MREQLRVAIETADEEADAQIRARLGEFNPNAVNRPERQDFNVVLRDDAGRLQGGLGKDLCA